MTPSEKLAADLCRRSFLSLWSYANPLKRDGRELCDALVVLGGDIVIFSVKEIALSDTADPETAEQRWTRAAIEKSVSQLRGARRELGSMTRVVRSDGNDGVLLPDVEARRVHLVAVAMGSGRKLAVQSGQWEAGGDYVHVLDERSLGLVLGELDTTADFIAYLRAKENFNGMIVTSGEEDLLGAYLLGGRKMPELEDGKTVLMVEDGIWAHVEVDPDMLARRKLEKFSYWWDGFIEGLISEPMESFVSSSPIDADTKESVLRAMAAESRFHRRLLTDAMLGLYRRAEHGVRTVRSPSGVAYVFATYGREWKPKDRHADLFSRCVITRGSTELGGEIRAVVGHGLVVDDPAAWPFDLVFVEQPWDERDKAFALEMRDKFGFLRDAERSRRKVREFPVSDSVPSERAKRNRAKRERRSRKRT